MPVHVVTVYNTLWLHPPTALCGHLDSRQWNIVRNLLYGIDGMKAIMCPCCGARGEFLRRVNTAAFNGAAVVGVKGWHYIIVTELIMGSNPFPNQMVQQVVVHAQIPEPLAPSMPAPVQMVAPKVELTAGAPQYGYGAPQQGYSTVTYGSSGFAGNYGAMPNYASGGYESIPSPQAQGGYYGYGDPNAHIPMAEVVVAKPIGGSGSFFSGSGSPGGKVYPDMVSPEFIGEQSNFMFASPPPPGQGMPPRPNTSGGSRKFVFIVPEGTSPGRMMTVPTPDGSIMSVQAEAHHTPGTVMHLPY